MQIEILPRKVSDSFIVVHYSVCPSAPRSNSETRAPRSSISIARAA
jgi:hypothetical protein